MKYVLDACIGAKWVLPEIDSPQARSLRDDLRNGLHEAIAPDLFPLEVGHALTRAERQGRVSAVDGLILGTQVMQDGPQLVPALPLIPRAYALSSQRRVGIYDCLYVALAEVKQCELLTADVRLLKTFQGIVRVVSLDSL